MENPEKMNKQSVMKYYGYKGFIGNLKYYYRFGTGRILQTLAYFAPLPKWVVVLNRMRGVKIGKYVYIGQCVQIDSRYPSLITLEDYVSVGVNSMIFAHSEPASNILLRKKYYPARVAPTLIKEGAWIAPGVIILCGVTIGEHSVIGAGSVVIKDVEPFTVVAGNPAKVIKKLEE